MSAFKNSDGKVVVQGIVKIIQDNKQYLSDVDGAIGDGDHGINMNKGFTISGKRLDEGEYSFASALEMLGDTLISEIGGSMGPIYGTLFIEMGETAGDKEQIDAVLYGEMLSNAVEGLEAIVDARVGDKTMMDVMIPSRDAYMAAVAEGKSFAEALTACSAAAVVGRDSTKDLVAKFGRASRLGERSRGVLDAGATSCELILTGLAEGIKKLL